MSAFFSKSWVFLFLFVLAADFGALLTAKEASLEDRDQQAQAWTLISQSGSGVDASPDSGDSDSSFSITAGPASALSSPSQSIIACIHSASSIRFELQPRTSQGPPALTV